MRVVAVIALLLLAGCSDPPSETVQEDPDVGLEDDLEATSETGLIRGVVVDAAIAPIANVTVRIDSLERETVTNHEGAFGFGSLDPGTYFLEASKLGYQAIQTSVDVQAGVDRPPVARIQMTADPSTAPYVQPYTFRGHMGCSLSYIALCGLPVVSDATNDEFLATFAVDRLPQWANLEAVWEGTQPTGNQMNLNFGATPAGPGTTFATAQGPSPLLAQANETAMAEHGVGAEDLVGRMFAWEMEGTNIQQHTGMCIPAVLTTYCQGPGMALSQDFEMFLHAFYNWIPDPDYRFTRDGDPVPPS